MPNGWPLQRRRSMRRYGVAETRSGAEPAVRSEPREERNVVVDDSR